MEAVLLGARLKLGSFRFLEKWGTMVHTELWWKMSALTGSGKLVLGKILVLTVIID